jgi:Protein of unknown function (DUF732)
VRIETADIGQPSIIRNLRHVTLSGPRVSAELERSLERLDEMTKKRSTCAFGALLALMVMPVAAASADTTDADFVNYLGSQGIHLGTASQTVNMAHAMCQDLTAGYTARDEVDQMLGAQRLTPAQAQVFIGAATADYCPDKHPATPPPAA